MLSAALRTTARQIPMGARCMGTAVPRFGTVDPMTVSGAHPHTVMNLVNGEWCGTKEHMTVPDPLNGDAFISCSATSTSDAELGPFVESLRKVPKSGVHNPLKNPGRYVALGDVSRKAGHLLAKPDVQDFFARLVQRVSPKSMAEARKEVHVTARFLQNFSADQVRFMARGFSVSGDRPGQESRGYRWPFGPVAVVTPFNFPIEIPVLQLFGALFMGNKPCLHVDHRVSIVMEQFLRMCIDECGLEPDAVDFLNGPGTTMGQLIEQAKPRNTLFTGSSKVAEILAKQTAGRVMLEDAGFDWKVLGPDAPKDDATTEYVAWQADQDAYACSGQKCSAQSILFAHKNWTQGTDLLHKMETLAGRRKMEDLTIGPVLTWTTEAMLAHANKLASISGAKVLWGAKELQGHSVPKVYGAIEPTAVFVPIEEMVKPENFGLCTTEVFGPMQVVTEFDDSQLSHVLDCMERMEHHLTAAVVSNDIPFRDTVLANTVNGTTYAGIRARTTGAPQNHWFGPAGDPRAAGIGTPEAIRLVWSTHREIIHDTDPVESSWTLPEAA